MTDALAAFGGRLATGLMQVTDDLAALDAGGWWAVVATFEGRITLARFADVRKARAPEHHWPGLRLPTWSSSVTQDRYQGDVSEIRERIAVGEVYQVNLCRLLSAPLPAGQADLLGLATKLRRQHPSRFGGVVHLPDHGVEVVTASPELFLLRHGNVVESGPIKGTAPDESQLLDKDVAENVMIVDLVRNDVGRVSDPGTVHVPSLLAVEQLPGLVHLVSTVRARLRKDVTWGDIFEATFPPGSVSGAPKSSALRAIGDLEPVPRGPYCGAVGWIDTDRDQAELAVGIRTFFLRTGERGRELCFGTGAGITWGSDPAGEWAETELKAQRLLSVASSATAAGGAS